MKTHSTMTYTEYVLHTAKMPKAYPRRLPRQSEISFVKVHRLARNRVGLCERVHKWAFQNQKDLLLIHTPLFRFEKRNVETILGGYNHFFQWHPWELRIIKKAEKEAAAAEKFEKKLDHDSKILHELNPYR